MSFAAAAKNLAQSGRTPALGNIATIASFANGAGALFTGKGVSISESVVSEIFKGLGIEASSAVVSQKADGSQPTTFYRDGNKVVATLSGNELKVREVPESLNAQIRELMAAPPADTYQQADSFGGM